MGILLHILRRWFQVTDTWELPGTYAYNYVCSWIYTNSKHDYKWMSYLQIVFSRPGNDKLGDNGDPYASFPAANQAS
jgi:hypothetical protein